MPSRMLSRISRLLISALLLATLAACAHLAPRDPLKIDLAGLEPLPGQGLEMRFKVKLRVQNPNDTSIDFHGVALELDINGQPLASGVSNQRGKVAGFGETVIEVPVTISAFSALRQTWGLAGYQPGQGVPYMIRGKLGGSLLGSVRFSDSGELEWPTPTQR